MEETVTGWATIFPLMLQDYACQENVMRRQSMRHACRPDNVETPITYSTMVCASLILVKLGFQVYHRTVGKKSSPAQDEDGDTIQDHRIVDTCGDVLVECGKFRVPLRSSHIFSGGKKFECPCINSYYRMQSHKKDYLYSVRLLEISDIVIVI